MRDKSEARGRHPAKKPKQQSQLIDDVLNINKKPQLKKPTRTEPSLQISEFNLVKSITGKQGVVRVNELTKVLKKRAKHVEIGKQVSSTRKKTSTLPKPLEKPQAERIRRTVAFEGVKKQLDRWDAVVTSNRASNHLSFPLPNLKLENDKKFGEFRLKTDLQKELEELEPKVEIFNIEEEPKYPLTMQEMIERRKEMAKVRAVQSYKEAKARRQSKIKSKKYHRIQRRQKIKQQLKEFELLQQTNPEEALKKLEEIEKVRVMERASLRHRSTGKWAKNKQVQAKYDKESRQVLAQQLTLSRELTQKIKVTNSDSESEEEVQNGPISNTSKDNPWTNSGKTPNEVEAFVSGYRKFWEDKNQQIKNENEIDTIKDVSSGAVNQNEDGNKNSNINVDQKYEPVENKSTLKNVKQTVIAKEQSQKDSQSKKIKSKESKPKRCRLQTGTSNWDIDYISDNSGDNEDNDKSTNDLETTNQPSNKHLKKALKKKYEMLKKELKKEEEISKKSNNRKTKKKQSQIKTNKKVSDLSLNIEPRRPVIKEQLAESYGDDSTGKNKDSLDALQLILKNSDSSNAQITSKNKANIDPNNIVKVKRVKLNTNVPDLLTVDLEDDEENTDQNIDMLEAFQDDDLVEEFRKDKQLEIDQEKPQDINLTLPGWGSWGGTGIKPSKRKDKRFIMRFPKKFKRRDDNKGDLIINEKANAKIKPHLVSEVPFPFKKTKDFEASVRAPIGNTFVPETAFRKMIRPPVVTKMGTIIEPITEDVLLKKKK